MLTILLVSWLVWIVLALVTYRFPSEGGGLFFGMVVFGSGGLLAIYSIGLFFYWLFQHFHWQ